MNNEIKSNQKRCINLLITILLLIPNIIYTEDISDEILLSSYNLIESKILEDTLTDKESTSLAKFENREYDNLTQAGAQLLHSYISMYKSTQNTVYLQKFIEYCEIVFFQRDDIYQTMTTRNRWSLNNHYYKPLGDTLPFPVWSTKASIKPDSIKQVYYPWVYDNGLITYPIALFAQEILKSETLKQLTYNTNNKTWKINKYDTQFFNKDMLWQHILNTENSTNNISYEEIANKFIDRIEETVSYFETKEWVDTVSNNIEMGYYRISEGVYSDEKNEQSEHIYFGKLRAPINMQASMGRTLISLCNIYDLKEDQQNANKYKDQSRKLATYFKSILTDHNDGQEYRWQYMEDYTDPYNPADSVGEDVYHGVLDIDFALLCYKNNMVFGLEDMQRFTNTFLSLYIKKYKFYEFFDRIDDRVNYRQIPFNKIFYIYAYLPLLEFDKQVAKIILNEIHVQYSKILVNAYSNIGPYGAVHMNLLSTLMTYKDSLIAHNNEDFHKLLNKPNYWRWLKLSNVNNKVISIDLNQDGKKNEFVMFYNSPISPNRMSIIGFTPQDSSFISYANRIIDTADTNDIQLDFSKIDAHIIALDLDSDGFEDDIAVLYKEQEDTISIWGFYNNDTTEIFTASKQYTGKLAFSNISNRVVALDLDRNGHKNDIAIFYDDGNNNTSVWGFYNIGNGFTASKRYTGNFDVSKIDSRIASLDLNSDGFEDDITLIYDDGNSTTSIWGFYNIGNGFTPSKRYTGNFTASNISGRLITLDLDANGYKNDIAIFYDDGNNDASIWGFYNIGNGFTPSKRYTGNFDVSKINNRITAIDLDSDGFEDDIILLYDQGYNESSIWGFNNIGNGFTGVIK